MPAQIIVNRHFRDLNPVLCGSEACKPGHRYGPAIRSCHLIHYVEAGKGIYETEGKQYPVGAGQAFLILPGRTTTYTADADDPWRYRWIGFDGGLAAAFDALPPVFSVADELFPRYPENVKAPEYTLAAGLLTLCGALFPDGGGERERGGNRYVAQVQEFVRLSYMWQDLRVEEIARQMNLDRRYLSRIFRQETGQTLQDFLISVRMQEAERYLRRGVPVGETAQLCGYADVFNFSKMFKKRFGVSPAEILKGAKCAGAEAGESTPCGCGY